ncbi:MAG TPA: polymer-forming cytoskeletal protein [Acidiferrobacteraceae bacterium]|nr:polymer-forming cytoskeletal protein [Acidiferrobacteraceae bacterium]
MLGNKKSGQKAATINTMISAKTEAIGNISFQGGMRIDGKVHGNVTAADDKSILVLSSSATVEGTVDAPTVIVSGSINGNLIARKRVELHADAHVEGDVHYSSLAMDPGAVVNGNLYHEQDYLNKTGTVKNA